MPANYPKLKQEDLVGSAVLLSGFIFLSLTAYMGLVTIFDFPDILRRPPEEIMAAFQAEQSAVRGFYYLFTFAHLVFAAGVIVMARTLRGWDNPWLEVATAGGVLYGVAQAAGFLRWPILVPMFAQLEGGAEQQSNAFLLLEAFHRYAGMAIGENLSFWGMAAWLVGIGVTLRRVNGSPQTVAWLWIVDGVLVALLTFEHLGGALAVL